jgi:type II secretory pathway pseudopilin PulG
MVGLIVGISLAILLGGWLWDRRKAASKQQR